MEKKKGIWGKGDQQKSILSLDKGDFAYTPEGEDLADGVFNC